ncbi:MAG TPA: hypothetical protein ENH82_03985 [bacterium]|nr:hypothetical protein [bacterium]
MLKMAHFGIQAPHSSGMYETIHDLILAERSVGIDAQLIDCGSDDKEQFKVREGLEDRGIKTMPLSWALDADVAIRHSVTPDEIYKKMPVVLALHGRPESSFRLEYNDKMPVISGIMKAVKSGVYKDIFTFWPEHIYLWEQITGNGRINYIPAPVNLDEYTPVGEKHDFGKFKAGINLIIADIWREDIIPFNLIFAAQYFRDTYYKDTKLHIYGVSNVQKSCFNFLAGMQKNGVIGEVSGVVGFLPKIYRSANILLTPNTIATRIVREAMASGLPIVAPHGCRYTPFIAEPRDYKAFASAINDCYNSTNNGAERADIRQRAKRLFNFEIVGNAMKQLCEKVLAGHSGQRILWNAMSITEIDWTVLQNFIKEHNIKSIVEFGAGISTQLFDNLGIKIISFETEKRWADKIAKKAPNANIVLWDGKTDPEISGDLAFIDGPHHGENREPSYKAVFESNIPIVACHDVHRPEDMQWVQKYFADWKSIIGTNNLLILERP